jgi:hypothetical protein
MPSACEHVVQDRLAAADAGADFRGAQLSNPKACATANTPMTKQIATRTM